MRPEPGAQAAAGQWASRTDRERVIDLLKAAFVQGRLDRDEFDARIGHAIASRTYGELAAVTADIPAELIGALPRQPPVRARRRISFNAAVTGGACMAVLVNVGTMAVLLSRNPVAVVLFVVFTIIGTILAIRAMIVAPLGRLDVPVYFTAIVLRLSVALCDRRSGLLPRINQVDPGFPEVFGVARGQDCAKSPAYGGYLGVEAVNGEAEAVALGDDRGVPDCGVGIERLNEFAERGEHLCGGS